MTHYSNTSNPVDFPKLSTVDRLWGEALDRAVPDTYSSLTWTQVEKIKTVFAELIVRECVEQMELVRKYRYDRVQPLENQQTIIDECQYQIKQHFGVDE